MKTAAGLLLLVSSLSGAFAGAAQQRPNVVFILADDLGYGDIGAFGQTKIRTPRLDQMAREGMRFTDHYAGSPVCGPSRASLMTGLHTGHSPIRGNPRWTRGGLPVDLTEADTTVAEVLRDAGYRTAIVGKWGLAERRGESLVAIFSLLRAGAAAFSSGRARGLAGAVPGPRLARTLNGDWRALPT